MEKLIPVKYFVSPSAISFFSLKIIVLVVIKKKKEMFSCPKNLLIKLIKSQSASIKRQICHFN